MKTLTKEITGAAYVAIQADLVARDGAVSAKFAHLFFQCAVINGTRTVDQWDALVVKANSAEVTIADVLAYDDEE